MILRERLADNGFKNIEEIVHEEVGEIIPERIEIRVGKETVAIIYQPIACHNYNTITIGTQEINVATIDTMLSFYLAFIYSDNYSYFKDRILCMAKYLFYVEEQNRLEQKGLLKRFSIKCIGKQPSLEEIRSEKALKFKELAKKRGTEEYEMWFLKYNPAENKKGKPIETLNSMEKNTEEDDFESSSSSESDSSSDEEDTKVLKKRVVKKKTGSIFSKIFGKKYTKKNGNKNKKTRKVFDKERNKKREKEGYLY
jgi:hypothetical protein